MIFSNKTIRVSSFPDDKIHSLSVLALPMISPNQPLLKCRFRNLNTPEVIERQIHEGQA